MVQTASTVQHLFVSHLSRGELTPEWYSAAQRARSRYSGKAGTLFSRLGPPATVRQLLCSESCSTGRRKTLAFVLRILWVSLCQR